MRLRVFLVVVAAVLLTPTAAHAKGADEASIEGEGITTPIVVSGTEGDSDTLGGLTELAGLFPAAFAQTPDPMTAAAPTALLGPRYTITWRIPAGDGSAQHVVQDVYPFADGGPVTYMAPGQTFMGTDRTRGGWYRSISALRVVLVHLGVPDHPLLGTTPATLRTTATPPAPPPTVAPAAMPAPSSDGWWSGTAAARLAGLLGLSALAGAGVAARRRGRVAPT